MRIQHLLLLLTISAGTLAPGRVAARGGPTAPPAPATALASPAPQPASPAPADPPISVTPGGWVQVDGGLFLGEYRPPRSGFQLRRARLELGGWIGSAVNFAIAAELLSPLPGELPAGASPPAALADAYVAIAPWRDQLILQVGQFALPFTLENRIPDSDTTFLERSLTVRALGVPRRRDVGAMVHGLTAGGLFYFAAGLFNGDGPGLRNRDNEVDAVGRALVLPFAGSPESLLGRAWLGGSAWTGRRVGGLALPQQATPGGFVFFEPRWTTGRAPGTQVELREQGRANVFAGELNAPIGHRFGLRAEVVYRHQQLLELDVTRAGEGITSGLGNAVLDALGFYGELWWWLVGDDRILPPPGLQLPVRPGVARPQAAPHGLMLALRGESLHENLKSDNARIANPNVATTRLLSAGAALSYWYTRRFRVSLNGLVHQFGGTTENVKVLAARTPRELELMLRFAVAL